MEDTKCKNDYSNNIYLKEYIEKSTLNRYDKDIRSYEKINEIIDNEINENNYILK